MWKRKPRKLCNSQKSIQIFSFTKRLGRLRHCPSIYLCMCSDCNMHTHIYLTFCCRFSFFSVFRLLCLCIFVFNKFLVGERKLKWEIRKNKVCWWWQIKWFRTNWLLLLIFSFSSREDEMKRDKAIEMDLFVLGFLPF